MLSSLMGVQAWAQDAVAGAAPAAGAGDPAKGEVLFSGNCASCHNPARKMTGPALKGALGRWDNKYEELTAFIKNSQAYMKSSGAKAEYAKKLYAEYNNTVMPPQNVSAADVKDLIAYIEAYVEPSAAAGPADGEGSKDSAIGLDSNALFYLLASVVGILLVVLLALILTIAVVARAVKAREEGQTATVADLRSSALSVFTNPFVKGLVGLAVFIGVSNATVNFLGSINLHDGYQPVQPIKFSHKIHAGQYKIACQYCHVGVERGKNATIPSTNICTNCHNEKGGIVEGSRWGKEELGKILASAKENKPIEWVKIHNLPDLVYFNHAQHVKVAGLECQECHGPIEEMEEVYQYSRLSMGWCVECHRNKEVDIEKSGYYKSVHQQIRENRETYGKITVEKLGGLECARCHY